MAEATALRHAKSEYQQREKTTPLRRTKSLDKAGKISRPFISPLHKIQSIKPPTTRAQSFAIHTSLVVHDKTLEDEAEDDAKLDESSAFVPSSGLSSSEAEALLAKWGPNELSEKVKPKWKMILELLTAPMPIMIWLAAITEASIQNWPDMGILLGIQFLNCSIAFYEMCKADNAVAALKASLKPVAVAKRDGKFINIPASNIVPGDLVLLGSGSAVPADCALNEGQLDVDQSALTGESLPVTLFKGDTAKMGSTVVRGETQATVEHTGKNTFFGKTADLLQVESGMGHLQKLLMKIMMVLVILSIALCTIALIYLLRKGEAFVVALSFMVVLLVASIPIAIEIVVTTTLATGSHFLSRKGAIVTRLAAIEDLAGMNMLCSDKTGTLTLNKMVIQDETPIYLKGEDQRSVLLLAAMAAKYEEPARDALDTLVLGSADLPALKPYKQIEYMPFDPTVKRTEGTMISPDGTKFKTTKGAPQIILKLIKDPAMHKQVETDVHDLGLRGIRSLAVAKTDAKGEWQMAGLLTFLDPPRPDTKHTLEKAHEFGVDVKMITGDHLLIATETARVLGMGTNIQESAGLPQLIDGKIPEGLAQNFGPKLLPVNGFAQVYPEHKFLIVETLRQMGKKVGMTGDGVNDAPALKRADVGVAVQGATDAARAAADIVLTQPGLSTIVDGIIISREIFQRMKNFLTYRIAATLQLLLFFFIAVLILHPVDFVPHPLPKGWQEKTWPEFFHMPVLMLMLITLLNDGALLSIGYDHVKASQEPDEWNIPALFAVASILAAVALGSSLYLLYVVLDSWNPHGLFQTFGFPGLTHGQITTIIYLKVSISDFLTLFSSRTDDWFWTVRPSPLLLLAFIIATATSTTLACAWPLSYPDGIETLGLARHVPRMMAVYIWIYCIVCWFLQDAAKVYAIKFMKAYNILGMSPRTEMAHGAHAHQLSSVASGTEKQPLTSEKTKDYGTHH